MNIAERKYERIIAKYGEEALKANDPAAQAEWDSWLSKNNVYILESMDQIEDHIEDNRTYQVTLFPRDPFSPSANWFLAQIQRPVVSDEIVDLHFIGDGAHQGTDFYWHERGEQWVVVDFERRTISMHDRIALVRCNGDADAGLNQECLGCDLDGHGLWLVDMEFVEESEEGYLYDVREVLPS